LEVPAWLVVVAVPKGERLPFEMVDANAKVFEEI